MPREPVAGTARHDAQRRRRIDQGTSDFVHRAITAHRHHHVGPGLHRRRRKLRRVPPSLGQTHRPCDLGRFQKILDQPKQLGPVPRRTRLRIKNETDVQKRKGIKPSDAPMKCESSEASSFGFSSAPSPKPAAEHQDRSNRCNDELFLHRASPPNLARGCQLRTPAPDPLLRHKLRRQLQAEITPRVGEADVLNHPADEAHVVWNLAAGDVAAEQVAQRAAEILVARITQEAA